MQCGTVKIMGRRYFFIDKEGVRIFFEACLLDELVSQLNRVRSELGG
jgi:hypothetical protein